MSLKKNRESPFERSKTFRENKNYLQLFCIVDYLNAFHVSVPKMNKGESLVNGNMAKLKNGLTGQVS